MTTRRKIFLILVALFFTILAWFVYDISKKSIFPGNPNSSSKSIDVGK